jgi:hypothetical protein
MMTKKTAEINIYPDTNIFLHFTPLNEIDLRSIFKAERVNVIICPKVIDELDQHKWSHPITGLKERAKTSLARINDWLSSTDSSIREKVYIKRVAKPTLSLLDSLNLDSRSNDDVILATIIQTKQEFSKIKHTLLTHDLGPSLRAGDHKIIAAKLPEDYLLPAARDELREDLLRVQRELAEYKLKSPILDLGFSNNLKEVEFDLLAQVPFAEDVAREQSRKRAKEIIDALPKASNPFKNSEGSPEQFSSLSHKISLFGEITKEESERFDREILDFENKYFTYLRKVNEIENARRKSIEYLFELTNSGTAVAKDIILQIILPEYMMWQTRPDWRPFPNPPTQPEPPKNQLQLMGIGASRLQGIEYMPASITGVPQSDSTKAPDFEFNGRIAKIRYLNLFHNNTVFFRALTASFVSISDISNHEIIYRIQEWENPKIIERKLLVKVKVE